MSSHDCSLITGHCFHLISLSRSHLSSLLLLLLESVDYCSGASSVCFLKDILFNVNLSIALNAVIFTGFMKMNLFTNVECNINL